MSTHTLLLTISHSVWFPWCVNALCDVYYLFAGIHILKNVLRCLYSFFSAKCFIMTDVSRECGMWSVCEYDPRLCALLAVFFFLKNHNMLLIEFSLWGPLRHVEETYLCYPFSQTSGLMLNCPPTRGIPLTTPESEGGDEWFISMFVSCHVLWFWKVFVTKAGSTQDMSTGPIKELHEVLCQMLLFID